MASRLKTIRRALGVVLLAMVVGAVWLLSRVERPMPVALEKQAAATPSGLGSAAPRPDEPAPPAPPLGAPPAGAEGPGSSAPGGPALAAPADPNAESGCADDFQLDWDGGSFRRLEARKACRDAGGRTDLTDVVLTLAQGGGAPGAGAGTSTQGMVVRGQKGDFPADETGPVLLWGSVSADTPDGLHLEGEAVELRRADHLIVAQVPVTFTTGDLTGEAASMEHDWESEDTHLSGNPVLRLVGARTTGRLVTVRGETIRLHQARQRVSSVGTGRIDFPGGTILGDRIEILLTDDRTDVASVTASGHASSITTSAASSGGELPVQRTLQAAEITHRFGRGSKLASMNGTGSVTLVGRPLSGTGATETIEGEHVDLAFSDDGTRLVRLEATGTPAKLGTADASARREVAGDRVQLRFGSGGDVERLDASGTVAAREMTHGPVGQATRTLSSTRLEVDLVAGRPSALAFDGAPARLEEVAPGADGRPAQRSVTTRRGRISFDAAGKASAGSLSGEVHAEGPDGVARADEARLAAGSTQVVLSGKASLEAEGRTSHGDEIIHDRVAGTVVVRGRQHTVVRAGANVAGLASISKESLPAYISSDDLTVHLADRRAVYRGGHPTLRRGDDELMADVLDIRDQDGTLEAQGSVRSRLRLGTGPAGQKDGEQIFDPAIPIEGTSDSLRHSKAEGLVVYTGSVRLSQEASVLTATDRVEVQLKGEPAQVDSLVATGDALFVSPAREGEGQRLEYRASDRIVRVTAGLRPARAKDAEGNFARGDVLEMTLGSPGIRVVGPSQGRARGVSVLGPPTAPALGTPSPGGTP